MHFNLANSQSLAAVIMPFKSSTPTQMMWPVGQKGKISVGFRQLDSTSSKHFVAQPCVCYVRSQKLRNNIFFFLLDSFYLMQRFCIQIKENFWLNVNLFRGWILKFTFQLQSFQLHNKQIKSKVFQISYLS